MSSSGGSGNSYRLNVTTVLITQQEGYMSDSMTDGHGGRECVGQGPPAGFGQTLSVFITQETPLVGG